MATAAELVMAPGAARPETAGARKDTPAAAGETSFAEVLDNEVQTSTDAETTDGTNAAATLAAAPSQAQPAPPPVTASAVELLIALQSGDATDVPPATETAEPAAAPPAAAPAVAPVVTPEITAAESAPAVAAPPAGKQPATTPALPQAPVEVAVTPEATAAEPVAATTAAPAAVAVAASKAVAPAAADASTETSEDGEPVVAPSTDVDASADPAAAAAAAAAAPAENPAAAAQAAAAPAQATVVAAAMPAPKSVASTTPQPEEKPASRVQPTARGDAPAADTQAVSTKSDAYVPNAASASQATGAAKPQTGSVQQVAADGTPDIKADAPAPTSSNTSTSFADLLAAGRGTADVAKAAPAHPAMQSAPPAVAQVYTRFVERFDGRAQRFEISLTPEELGRVDVRIEIGADKKVHAVLAAHDSAALTDLMRGQRALERALTDAGIDLKDGGVKFELANDSNRGLAGQQHRDGPAGEDKNVWRGFSTAEVPVEADAPMAMASYRRATRLDLVA